MTLVAPDPTRTVPLPLRAQADVRDRWLTQRLLDLLPGLMDRAGIDLWLVVGREYNEDPVLATLLPATWLSARRRTILVLHRSDDGVTAAAVSRYPVGQFLPAWSPEEDGRPAEESQWAEVRRIVEQAAPRRIGIDVSTDFALADGLSCTEHRLIAEALGPWADRLASAEELAVGWLETRLPEEIAALHGLNRLVREVVEEAFSPAVLTVGVTTATDLAWWLRQRLADLGVEPWFHPVVDLQRTATAPMDEYGALLPAVPYDVPVEPGDLVHCDVGLSSLGLKTDNQRNGYVLRRGETDAPAGLRRALATGNRLQDLTTAELLAGRTGNEVLAAARYAAAAEGIDGDIYSHPVGFHGHGAGPAIGRWDDQRGVPGAGDRVLRPDTVYALELCVRVPVPEWGGQPVRMALEEGIALTEDGVSYLGDRQTELVLIPGA
ncbi:M24 family metallopeptidase [Geodermatophilus sp. DF01-2]|uniref:M24 family metallopeptidase n=1 Tax=Geodermatophilus sp. DF01-2 TaxID=2559610 RepID=UPI0010740DFF|nr:M24 family metallopeptidase [Geodermatophilus sp. DF01_2]TFV57440.1 M24 family metallopeptidase [Geodermatophilus sp. DF01_2]